MYMGSAYVRHISSYLKLVDQNNLEYNPSGPLLLSLLESELKNGLALLLTLLLPPPGLAPTPTLFLSWTGSNTHSLSVAPLKIGDIHNDDGPVQISLSNPTNCYYHDNIQRSDLRLWSLQENMLDPVGRMHAALENGESPL